MDPSKSESCPPSDWAAEKSMGQAAPPPYHDNPNPGHQQTGPGYPQPGPGYPQPGPGYPQPGQGYPPQQYGFPPQYGGQAGYSQQQYPVGQPVTIQPTVYVTRGPLANPVNDYLGYSIFTMLCCCLPLGIAALIYSISAREANHSGDQMAAERSSRTARTLNHLGLGLGIGVIILTIIYMVVVASIIKE